MRSILASRHFSSHNWHRAISSTFKSGLHRVDCGNGNVLSLFLHCWRYSSREDATNTAEAYK